MECVFYKFFELMLQKWLENISLFEIMVSVAFLFLKVGQRDWSDQIFKTQFQKPQSPAHLIYSAFPEVDPNRASRDGNR